MSVKNKITSSENKQNIETCRNGTALLQNILAEA